MLCMVCVYSTWYTFFFRVVLPPNERPWHPLARTADGRQVDRNPPCISLLSPCKPDPTFGNHLLDNPYATSILLQMLFYSSSSYGAFHTSYFSFGGLFVCWPFYTDLAQEYKVRLGAVWSRRKNKKKKGRLCSVWAHAECSWKREP